MPGASKYEKALFAFISCYVLVLSILTSLRHYCFKTLAFDMGIFVQIFWHSANGNLLFTQPRWGETRPTNFFGVHFSPLLIALIKIYELLLDSYLILVIQSIALALPAYYVFRIAEHVTGDEGLSLVFAAGYLLYPGTLWSNWYDFHLESFVPLFMSMAYYYYLRDRKGRLFASLVLLLTVFERSVFIVASFVIYIFSRSILLRRRGEPGPPGHLQGTAVLLFSLFVLSVVYFEVSERVMNGFWPERSLYEPARIFGEISYEDVLVKLSYLTVLAAPLAFLQLNSALELVPAAPYLFLAMTTDYSPYYTINWQYPALVSVPFFVSAIFGSAKERPRRAKAKVMIAVAAFFVLLAPGSPLMSQFGRNFTLPIPTRETQLRHQAIAELEPDATVLAQENIFPNVAERQCAYTLWPEGLEPPDYVIFDVQEYWFYHEPEGHTIKDAALRLLGEHDYGIWASVNGFIVLKRGYDGPKAYSNPVGFSMEIGGLERHFVTFEDHSRETNFFTPDWVRSVGDHLLIEDTYSGPVWWGPYITLPPGRYGVEVVVEADEPIEGPFLEVVVYWYRHAWYASRVFTGGEVEPGRRSTLRFEFELGSWVPALEVVGRTYGDSVFRVYEVRVEEIT